MLLSDPAFSDDGKYLMLVSARDFKPIFGQEQWENVYRDMTRVYLLDAGEGHGAAACTAQRRGGAAAG